MQNKMGDIVFGFKDMSHEDAEKMKDAFALKGVNFSHVCVKYTKKQIWQKAKDDENVRTVIVMENLETKPFTATELKKIKDIRDEMKVIVCLSNNRKGTGYMKELYENGIYRAVFDDNTEFRYIYSLVCESRSRKATRKYYGLPEPKMLNTSSMNKERIRKNVALLEDAVNEREMEEILNHMKNMLTPPEIFVVLKHTSESALEKIILCNGVGLFFYMNDYRKAKNEEGKGGLVSKFIRGGKTVYASDYLIDEDELEKRLEKAMQIEEKQLVASVSDKENTTDEDSVDDDNNTEDSVVLYSNVEEAFAVNDTENSFEVVEEQLEVPDNEENVDNIIDFTVDMKGILEKEIGEKTEDAHPDAENNKLNMVVQTDDEKYTSESESSGIEIENMSREPEDLSIIFEENTDEENMHIEEFDREMEKNVSETEGLPNIDLELNGTESDINNNTDVSFSVVEEQKFEDKYEKNIQSELSSVQNPEITERREDGNFSSVIPLTFKRRESSAKKNRNNNPPEQINLLDGGTDSDSKGSVETREDIGTENSRQNVDDGKKIVEHTIGDIVVKNYGNLLFDENAKEERKKTRKALKVEGKKLARADAADKNKDCRTTCFVVSGEAKRCGTTFHSIAIAYSLAEKGENVGICEYGNVPKFNEVAKMLNKENGKDGFWHKNVHFLSVSSPNEIEAVRYSGNYEFFIIDGGVFKNIGNKVFGFADVRFGILNSMPWNIIDNRKFIGEMNERNYSDTIYILPGAKKEYIENYPETDILCCSWQADAFVPDKEYINMIQSRINYK